jgi:hypothetical protein
MYFPRNWEFGSDLSKLRNNFGGVWTPQTPPLGTPLLCSIYTLTKLDNFVGFEVANGCLLGHATVGFGGFYCEVRPTCCIRSASTSLPGSTVSRRSRSISRSTLFWDITQVRVVNPYRRFGTTYPSHLRSSSSPRCFLLPCLRCVTAKKSTFLICISDVSLRSRK